MKKYISVLLDGLITFTSGILATLQAGEVNSNVVLVSGLAAAISVLKGWKTLMSIENGNM